MSWLFSQALAAAYSAANSSGGAPSAPLKSTPLPLAYCAPGKTTDFSRLSQYGVTCACSTDAHGAALLTWFRAGFPARTSAPPAAASASPARKAACGPSSRASFAKWNRRSCSWKTPPSSPRAASATSLATWPRWGSMRNGVCWARTRSAPRIAANAFGFWLPTPTANEAFKSKLPDYAILNSKYGCTIHSMTRWLLARHGLAVNARLTSWMMGWPPGWISFAPLAMDKFQLWLRSHGAP